MEINGLLLCPHEPETGYYTQADGLCLDYQALLL
jgi:hypothetical protein